MIAGAHRDCVLKVTIRRAGERILPEAELLALLLSLRGRALSLLMFGHHMGHVPQAHGRVPSVTSIFEVE